MKIATTTFIVFLFSSIVAKEVRVASTTSLPPYLNTDRQTGIEIEIIKAAFKSQEYDKVELIDVNFKRGQFLLNEGKVDGVISNDANTFYSKDLFKSDRTLNYVDCAIHLMTNQFNSILELKDQKVWGFKSASKVLGDEFAKMVSLNKRYTENHDQKMQPLAVLNKRVDVVVSDKSIFVQQMKEKGLLERINELDFTSINSHTKRVIRFKNKKLRDIFNKGLERIKRNGVYKDILKKYSKRYFEKC